MIEQILKQVVLFSLNGASIRRGAQFMGCSLRTVVIMYCHPYGVITVYGFHKRATNR